MKLHLPKKLLAVVLFCVSAAGTTYAEATYTRGSEVSLPNVININFAGEKASTVDKPGVVSLPCGETSYDYASSAWTTVYGATSNGVTVTDLSGEEYTLTWSSSNLYQSNVSTDTLTGAITKGYLDMGQNGSLSFTLSATDGTNLNWKQVNIILSGDSGAFGKVQVGRTEYYYDGETLTEVPEGGNPTWGTRAGSTSLTEGTNLMCVTNPNTADATETTLTVTGKSNSTNRATIAGVQIVLGESLIEAADTGTISGLVEGESVSASGLGLETFYSGTFTVNVTPTENVLDDVAELTLDQGLRVGRLNVTGGGLRLNVNEGNNFSGSIELGSNASLALGGAGVISVNSLSLGNGTSKLILENGVSVTIGTKLARSIAADTFKAGEGSTLSVAGDYTDPDGLKAVLNSFTGAGTLIFSDAQTDVQPTGNAMDIAVVNKKVVFDRGLAFSGAGQTNQNFTVGSGAEVTINNGALAPRRVNFNVDGGKLTANAGILIGHSSNGDFDGWVNLSGGEIVTTSIKGQNNNSGNNNTPFSAFTMTGGTLTITGTEAFGLTDSGKKLAVHLQGGTIKAGANQMNLAETAYATSSNLVFEIGNVTFDTGTGNTINLNHAFTQTGTLTVTGSGTLNLSGNVTLSDINALTASGYTDKTDTGNGYASDRRYLIKKVATGDTAPTLSITGNFTIADASGTSTPLTYVKDDVTGDCYIQTEGSDKTYYINKGNVDYGVDTNYAAKEGEDGTTGLVLNGGSLTMKRNLVDGVNITLAADGTVSLEKKDAQNRDVVLSKDRVTMNGHTLTLSGSGKYVAADTSVSHNSETTTTNLSDYMGATLGDGWTGTVKFDGGDFWGANLGSITKGSIELSGVSGMFAKGASTCTANLILTDKSEEIAAFSVNNGWGGDHVTFSGAVSGGGTLKRSTRSGSNKTFTFTGDVSKWTGKFDSAFSDGSGYNTLIEFSENATTIKASVTSTGDSLVNVTINNDSNVTVSGQIELAATSADRNGTLALEGDGAKSFTNTVTAGNITISDGTANFGNTVTTKTLTVGAATTMSALNLSGTATLNANLTVTGDTTLATTSSSIAIGEGKIFSTDGGILTVTGTANSTEITTSAADAEVTTTNEAITISNAAVRVNSTTDYTLGAKLSGSTLTNTGAGTATVNVAEGTTNDFDASSGSVTIGAPTASVGDLTVGDGKTVTIDDGSGTAEVSGTATLASGSTVSGNMTIADSGTLVIGGTDFSENGLGATVEGTLTANATAVSMAEESKIDVTNVTTTTTYVLATAQDMRFTGNFDAANFYTGTLAAGMTAAVTVQSMQTATHAINPATASQLVLTLTEGPVTLTATATATYTAATKTLNINVDGYDMQSLLSNFANKDLAVTVDSKAWASIVDAMSGVEGGVYNNAIITLDGVTLDYFGDTVSFNGYTGTSTKGEYFVAYIPEPTAATLSLLALAALAARRRRK